MNIAIPGWLTAAMLLLAPASCHAGAAEPAFDILTIESTRFELQFAPGFDAAARKDAAEWISRSARTVRNYFGRFPAKAATILIVPVEGDRVASGTTFNDGELRIRARVGRNIVRERYLTDWIMVHEMVHLAIPEVPRHQYWFHEGAATYIEIVARKQAGLSGEDGGWAELYRNVHRGLPQTGDRGLDRSPTLGRIYWGGALFCLMADIELRKQSLNRVGLQDAMRGLVASGVNYSAAWPLERSLAAADAATGRTVLTDLHRRLKDSALPTADELAALSRNLGIAERQGAMVWNDDAPLAAIRRAIMAPRGEAAIKVPAN